MRFLDSIRRIVVSEYESFENQVVLEIYCSNLIDGARNKLRYNVFYLKTKVNEKWICEGDLGKGKKF